MSDEKDKKVDAKMEGVDVSGYMPPGMCPPPGPVAPYPPEMPVQPPMMPGCDSLVGRLRALMGQQITVYVTGMGPVGTVPTLPTAGVGVMPGTGALGITGILHEVGMDYLMLHVDIGAGTRVVYVPLMSVAAVVPGGPLIPEVVTAPVTTVPGVI